MNWISSDGGPLLLLPQSLLHYWRGIEPAKDGREIEAVFRWNEKVGATDYDRACDVEDYSGIIKVGSGEGLVLGDEPNATAWYPLADKVGGILVRWVYASGDQLLENFLSCLPQELKWESNGQIFFPEKLLVLFDSAELGDEIIGEKLEIELIEGKFEVETLIYKPDESTHLTLHRLTQRF